MLKTTSREERGGRFSKKKREERIVRKGVGEKEKGRVKEAKE